MDGECCSSSEITTQHAGAGRRDAPRAACSRTEPRAASRCPALLSLPSQPRSSLAAPQSSCGAAQLEPKGPAPGLSISGKGAARLSKRSQNAQAQASLLGHGMGLVPKTQPRKRRRRCWRCTGVNTALPFLLSGGRTAREGQTGAFRQLPSPGVPRQLGRVWDPDAKRQLGVVLPAAREENELSWQRGLLLSTWEGAFSLTWLGQEALLGTGARRGPAQGRCG